MAITYLTTAETAKLVRAKLKELYPTVKFSVRSKDYSGGSSISVEWKDGPTQPAVQKQVDAYRGADFDSMTDSKTYRSGPLQVAEGGALEQISYGADYIFARREYSPAYGEWCTDLELYTQPSLKDQLAGMWERIVRGGGPTHSTSYQAHENGNGLISSAGYEAERSFRQWAACLQVQGYTAEVGDEATELGTLYSLAIYVPQAGLSQATAA